MKFWQRFKTMLEFLVLTTSLGVNAIQIAEYLGLYVSK